ncbi:MAG: SDR family NAD(P)-dependent oxidoreductase [Gammaproteobacteria bacterium]
MQNKQTDGAREWENAAAVITGAGSGVGAAVAELFAAAGAKLLLVGRDENKLRQTRARVGDSPCECFAGDLADAGFCRAVPAKAENLFGRLDVLVNSAGVIRRGAAAHTSDEAWRETMQINLDAVFYLSRAAAEIMRRQKNGAVVNISSTLGLAGCGGLAAYCASKGGVVQLTRALALEWAAEGITVNAVCPGAIDTPMLFSGHPSGTTEEQTRAKNIALIPRGRLATAAEVARAVKFLASESHITGAALPVDGGYTAQ